VLGQAARLPGHRRQPALVDLQLARHDGEGQPREGLELVRQRVGVLEPARRPVPVPRPRRAISLPTLDDLDVEGKRVPGRADLSVPVEGGRITDDFRIRAFEPTLERLKGASQVVVCSHFGRPKGPDPKYSLQVVADALGVPLAAGYANAPDDRIVLLENLR